MRIPRALMNKIFKFISFVEREQEKLAEKKKNSPRWLENYTSSLMYSHRQIIYSYLENIY